MPTTTQFNAVVLDPQERQLLRSVRRALKAAPLAPAERVHCTRELHTQLRRLGLLARAAQQAPSVYGEQRIGRLRRDLHSLIDTLSQSSEFDIELHMPMRAMISRTLRMGRINFLRLLRHVLNESASAVASAEHEELASRIERAICTCIQAKVVEEILIAIACDTKLDATPRRKAAATLCQMWEGRLTEQVIDFVAVLESIWQARRQTKVVFGTLTGVAELFDLVRAGCDGRFLDLFSQQSINQDQCMAFQEFLFLATEPELDRLVNHLRHTSHSLGPDQAARLLDSPPQRFDLTSRSAEKMYESFRRRHMAATIRRFRAEGGASRTAEEYIMLHLLAQTEMDDLACDLSQMP